MIVPLSVDDTGEVTQMSRSARLSSLVERVLATGEVSIEAVMTDYASRPRPPVETWTCWPTSSW